MNKPFYRILHATASLFFLFAASCVTTPETNPQAFSEPKELLIVHTNDVHGNVREVQIRRGEERITVGGSASLATLLAHLRAQGDTDRILLLDGGDIFQGTPEGNESKGRLLVDVMNRLGYDAVAVGNHELDYGIENFIELAKKSKFSWMAENFVVTKTGARPKELSAPRIIRRNGVNVGVFGLITENLSKVTTLTETAIWQDIAETPAALRAAKKLREDGADIVVMISHIGLSNDSAVARAVLNEKLASGRKQPLIDIIVGGHSHTRLTRPVWISSIPIVQAGNRGTSAGTLRFRWNEEQSRVDSIVYELVDLEHDTFPPDSEMVEFLKPYFDEIDKVMNEIVGKTLGEFKRGPRGPVSSSIGNLYTDIMRHEGNADIAFHNKGGIRADLPAGPIRLRDLYQVSPFGNTLVTMKLSGAEILDLLAHSLDDGYTTLEMSGLVVWFDTALEKGKRIVKVEHDGVLLDPAREYVVATNGFLGGGGDDYHHFKAGREWRDTMRTNLEGEVAWFRAHPEGLAPGDEKRWRNVHEP